MKKFFGLPDKGLLELNRVVIIKDDNCEFGILADRIVGVRTVPVEGIQPTLATITDIGAEYLKGITGERTVLLEVAAVLADAKIVVNEVV